MTPDDIALGIARIDRERTQLHHRNWHLFQSKSKKASFRNRYFSPGTLFLLVYLTTVATWLVHRLA